MLVCKYKYDTNLCADYMPVFNDGYANYTISDIDNGDGIVTRTIEHESELPTTMRFGRASGIYVPGNEVALLEVLDINTSELTTCYEMFRYCKNLTTVIFNWDISKNINTGSLFQGCTSLTSLNLNKFDSFSVATNMMYNCESLTSIDMSNIKLDTSFSSAYTNMFTNCKNLKDIGMLYCDKDTVNLIASLIPQGTIWVLDTDPSEYEYSNIKKYGTTIQLNSPLLKGDKLVTKNGKLYHWHKMSKVLMDGSEDWTQHEYEYDTHIRVQIPFNGDLNTKLLCDRFVWDIVNVINKILCVDNKLTIFIEKSKLSTQDANGFKQWLQANPTTVIYELAEPYYELLGDIDSSIIDLNGTKIEVYHETAVPEGVDTFHKYTEELNVLSANTKYRVTFDCDTADIPLDITLGGTTVNIITVEGTNTALITTPKPLVDNNLLIDGLEIDCKLENVTITEGDVLYDHFEGLYNAFENTLVTDEEDEHYGKYRVVVDLNGVEDEIYLNSPLLEGDTVEEIDGKVYHVHRYKKLILDGSDDEGVTNHNSDWQDSDGELDAFQIILSDSPLGWYATDGVTSTKVYCDRFIFRAGRDYAVGNVNKLTGIGQDSGGRLVFVIQNELINYNALDGFKSWLSENPTTVVYPLKSPVYELISDDRLNLSLADTTNNIVNNNSLLPASMDIRDKGILSVAVQPSTTYTVAFDKSIPDSTVILELCGSDRILTTKNEVQITTPATINDNRLRFIGEDGCIVSNIRLLEGTIEGDAIPEETFEGIMNSFEDGLVTDEADENYGKYRVEYKVTGKNKFDMSKVQRDLGNITYAYKDNMIYINGTTTQNYQNSEYLGLCLVPEKSYRLSFETDNTDKKLAYPVVSYYDGNGNIKYITTHTTTWFTWKKHYTKPVIYLQIDNKDSVFNNNWYKVQLEEGTEATEYEPYKEYTKTFYLNSPLLEEDTIEDINGVATHVKKYEKMILDGSEDWSCYANGDITSVFCLKTLKDKLAEGINLYCDKFLSRFGSWNVDSRQEGIQVDADIALAIQIDNSKLSAADVNGFKQWLQANPTTVVCQLASPIYQPISEESILCDSYVNGHLDVTTNIPIEKVQFTNNLNEYLRYLKANTSYVIKFVSDNAGKMDLINIGGNSISSFNVVKGENTVKFTTGEVVDNSISMTGIGFNISNIQVVEATRTDFGYFKGLMSSFEDGLVTDEADENYGKYKVEYKVTGKNKFDGQLEYGEIRYSTTGEKFNEESTRCISVNYISVLPNTKYTLSIDTGIEGDHFGNQVFVMQYDEDKNYLSKYTTQRTFTTDSKAKYILLYLFNNHNINSKVQIEEGAVATEYEPYKEYTKTLYLNSPLLEGDTIEDVDGVATHIKRYDKAVLDGSDDEEWTYEGAGITPDYSFTNTYRAGIYLPKLVYYSWTEVCNNDCSSFVISDKFISLNVTVNNYNTDIEHFSFWDYGRIVIGINQSKLLSDSEESFRDYLHSNPITVIYKLASPIYEPISTESILCDSYVNGHLDFDSIVPISRVEFKLSEVGLHSVQPSTEYTIQFNSSIAGDIHLKIGSFSLINNPVVKGFNRFIITTPTEINGDRIVLDGPEGVISDLALVPTNKEFDCFEGLKSCFEEFITEDGKYEATVRITSSENELLESYRTLYLTSPLLKEDTIEVINGTLSHVHRHQYRDYEEGDYESYITDGIKTLVKLEEPIVENIEPLQASLVLDSIKEGDLEVITNVPISYMSVTYTTSIPSASRIEDELNAVQTVQNEQDAAIIDNAVNIAMMQLTM